MRRMRFVVDAGLKAMKDHLAASGTFRYATACRPRRRVASGSSSTGTSDGHARAQEPACRDDSPETPKP
ncbi:MAG: hypothetical protein ACLRWP_21705 [Bilophila wadsworthia]